MPIALADLLTEQQVILRLRSRKSANAIREIVDVLASDIGGRKIAKPEAFLEQVFAREQTHASLVEDGVTFPHARTDLVDEIVIGVGRSRAGIPFCETQQRAHLIFVIGVPERLLSDYLVCVGTLARLVKDKTIRSRLLNAETPREFIEALTAEFCCRVSGRRATSAYANSRMARSTVSTSCGVLTILHATRAYDMRYGVVEATMRCARRRSTTSSVFV